MIYRFLYSIRHAWRHRLELSGINARAFSLTAIDFQALAQDGKKAIVFDFDGVLSPHGYSKPDNAGQSLLEAALDYFSHVYILSNKPTPARLEYFHTHYPRVKFIVVARKKPFPDGLEEIMADSKLLPNEICLIDDRLLTGVLACVLSEVTPLFIHDPRIDYSYHFMIECAFQGLRKFERLIFRGRS